MFKRISCFSIIGIATVSTLLSGCATEPQVAPKPLTPATTLSATEQHAADEAAFAAQTAQDAKLNQAIATALTENHIGNIHIKSYQGIVQLDGNVASIAESKRAEQITYSVPGVRYVNNVLQVPRVKKYKHHHR